MIYAGLKMEEKMDPSRFGLDKPINLWQRYLSPYPQIYIEVGNNEGCTYTMRALNVHNPPQVRVVGADVAHVGTVKKYKNGRSL